MYSYQSLVIGIGLNLLAMSLACAGITPGEVRIGTYNSPPQDSVKLSASFNVGYNQAEKGDYIYVYANPELASIYAYDADSNKSFYCTQMNTDDETNISLRKLATGAASGKHIDATVLKNGSSCVALAVELNTADQQR